MLVVGRGDGGEEKVRVREMRRARRGGFMAVMCLCEILECEELMRLFCLDTGEKGDEDNIYSNTRVWHMVRSRPYPQLLY